MDFNNNIIPAAEVEESTKACKFCGKELDFNMNFCTRCGKSQEENVESEPRKKRVVRIVKKKKISLPKIFSFVSFGISMVIMLFALTRMFFYNTTVISIFGTSNDAVIINQTYVIGSLIISLMFMLFGMFLYKIKD